MDDRHAEARDRKRAKARKMAVNGRSVFTMDQAERARGVSRETPARHNAK